MGIGLGLETHLDMSSSALDKLVGYPTYYYPPPSPAPTACHSPRPLGITSSPGAGDNRGPAGMRAYNYAFTGRDLAPFPPWWEQGYGGGMGLPNPPCHYHTFYSRLVHHYLMVGGHTLGLRASTCSLRAPFSWAGHVGLMACHCAIHLPVPWTYNLSVLGSGPGGRNLVLSSSPAPPPHLHDTTTNRSLERRRAGGRAGGRAGFLYVCARTS